MSVEEFFDPAVDPAFDVIRCSRYFSVPDEREEIRQAVPDETPDSPEFFVSVPPASLLVLHISVASFGKKAMIFSAPALPTANPATSLSSGANRRQFFDEFAEVLSGKRFGMEREFGEGLPQDMDQTPLEWYFWPTPSYRCKEPALAVADDRSRRR